MHIVLGFLTYLVVFALFIYFISRSELAHSSKIVFVCLVGVLAGTLVMGYMLYLAVNDLNAGNTPGTYFECLWWIIRGYLSLPKLIIEGFSALSQGKWGDVVQCVGYLVLPACCGIGLSLKAIREYDDDILMIFLMVLLSAVLGFVSMLITALGWGIVNYFDPDSFAGFIVMIVILAGILSCGGGIIIFFI